MSVTYRSEGKETSQAPLPSTATGSAKIAAIQKAVQRQSRKKPADDAYTVRCLWAPFRELVPPQVINVTQDTGDSYGLSV